MVGIGLDVVIAVNCHIVVCDCRILIVFVRRGVGNGGTGGGTVRIKIKEIRRIPFANNVGSANDVGHGQWGDNTFQY